MKTRPVPTTAKMPRKQTERTYKNLEVARERRALEIHPSIKKEPESNEISSWTEAEADMLEG